MLVLLSLAIPSSDGVESVADDETAVSIGREKSSSVVDRTQILKQFSYNPEAVQAVQALRIDWRFVSRAELAALDGLLGELPRDKATDVRAKVGDVHIVVRVTSTLCLGCNLTHLKLRFKPRGYGLNHSHTFEVRVIPSAPVIYGIHPVIGGESVLDDVREKCRTGDWVVWIEEIGFGKGFK